MTLEEIENKAYDIGMRYRDQQILKNLEGVRSIRTEWWEFRESLHGESRHRAIHVYASAACGWPKLPTGTDYVQAHQDKNSAYFERFPPKR